MNAILPNHSFAPRPGEEPASSGEAGRSAPWALPSAWIAFAAGLGTPFVISVGGEMPVGEIVLMFTAAWAVVCALINRAWPGELLKHRLLWWWLAAQLLALAAYVFSDLYRQSFPRDMARGWARMVFLAVDIVAIAYLCGRSPRNLLALLAGQSVGVVASALLLGPMFGDMWKFGVGAPLTFLALWLAPAAGAPLAVLACAGMGVAHFILGYRSMGALCLMAGVLAGLQAMAPGRPRLWLAPALTALGAAAVFWVYSKTDTRGELRTSRSDVERSAMVTAAAEAVARSPFIGHGSWFSNTDVYANFTLIRGIAAREANVGGFPEAADDPGTTALHSQILVALAEGGVLGGAFFFVFGAGLLRTLYRLVLLVRWHRLAPLCTLLLLSALWNLLFSPFSGAHRVHIAMACGLMLLLQDGALIPRAEEAHAHEGV